MEGSYYILLSATLLRYNILQRPLTKATFRESTSIIQYIAGQDMEHPSLYCSSQQMPYLDAMNSASHPETGSMTRHHHDRLCSVASGLDDLQTVHNIGMNNYLSPGLDSCYNTPSQLDEHALGIKKECSRSPVDLDLYRTSTTTSLFRCGYIPLKADCSAMDSLHDIPTNDQGLGWREQLEAHADWYRPSDFQPQGIAHGSNFPTDAPPCAQFTPQGPSNAQHIGSRPIQYSGDDLCPAAPPHQACSTTFDFGYTAPPQMSDPSYISTPVALSPRIKSEHCEPLGLPFDSGVFSTCYPTWNVPDDIKTESLDTFTPSHYSRHVSELTDFESPYINPIPRLQRPRRRRNPTAIRSEPVDSSNSSTSPHPTPLPLLPPPPPPPPTSDSKNIDSLTTLTPSRPIEHDPSVTNPQPSNNSVETEIDPDEIFRKFTTFYDNIYLRGGCQMVDLSTPDVPNIQKEHVPDASEPGTAQHSADQPAGDAGSEQTKSMLQVKKRKRATSDAKPTEPEQHQPAKKPRKKKNSSAALEHGSEDPRRKTPAYIYFCADWECCRSLNSDFHGFRTKEDAQRHLLVHEPDRFFCSFKHSNCQDFSCKRADNFRK